MTQHPSDFSLATSLKDSYRRYIVGKIGDVGQMGDPELLGWGLALEELAEDFQFLVSAKNHEFRDRLSIAGNSGVATYR